jgi:hypothetical protein
MGERFREHLASLLERKVIDGVDDEQRHRRIVGSVAVKIARASPLGESHSARESHALENASDMPRIVSRRMNSGRL